MGLAISIGLLADLIENDSEGEDWLRGKLVIVNKNLRKEGHPDHHEPETLPPINRRIGTSSFPYSFLHYLRRVYARVKQNRDWIASPLPEGANPARDEAVEEETYMFSSHLLCHSDAEGFYVPIDFKSPIFSDDLPGGMLGSSYRLLEELRLVTGSLGITLDDDGNLSDEEAKRLIDLAWEEDPLHREYETWLTLFESARISIAHKTAIVFH